jgi:hypothetical protein
MTRRLAGIGLVIVAVAWTHSSGARSVSPAQAGHCRDRVRANSQAGTVALVDVAARAGGGPSTSIPARVKSQGPGAPNYAQDTDVSPDGRTLYVSRGYVGDVVAFDIASGRMLWTRPLNTVRADHMTLTRDWAQLVRVCDCSTTVSTESPQPPARSPDTL